MTCDPKNIFADEGWFIVVQEKIPAIYFKCNITEVQKYELLFHRSLCYNLIAVINLNSYQIYKLWETNYLSPIIFHTCAV